MRSILSKLVLMSTVAATALVANAAMAESRVQVPFAFDVAGQSWPAGTYTIQKIASTHAVLLQSADSSKSFTRVAVPGDPAPTDTRIVLTFAEGDQFHALKSIQYGPAVASVPNKNRKANELLPVRMVQGQ